jgi:hypothetical protein
MDVTDTVQKGVDWIHLVKDRDQGQDTVCIVMHILFLREFFSEYALIVYGFLWTLDNC